MLYTVHESFILIFYDLRPIALNNLTEKAWIFL